MLRRGLIAACLSLTFAACAPGAEDDFQWGDAREADDSRAFHTVAGQSSDVVVPGDFVIVALVSDPGANVGSFSTQSFLACDQADWAIEHEVTTYVAAGDPEAWDLDPDTSAVSEIGFVVSDFVRDGTQMVVDPFGYDHEFEFTVELGAL